MQAATSGLILKATASYPGLALARQEPSLLRWLRLPFPDVRTRQEK